MKISVRGRYALAAMMHMSVNYERGEYLTVISISERLGISKIYLEQVFSQLKRGGLIDSIKGAKGGYKLARAPRRITAEDILLIVEPAIFEEPQGTAPEKAPEIDKAMRLCVFRVIDDKIREALRSITLDNLVLEAEKLKADDSIMFFI